VTDEPNRGPQPAGVPVALVVLLGAALLINYVDRGTASMAGPSLESELHLSDEQLGWVLSAFFWGYVPAQPLMGWLADRLGAARVLAAGFLLWSVATFLAGFSRGVLTLCALRLVMGVGESVTYPSALALLAQRVGDRHRARATSVFQLGGVAGPALGAFLGGWILQLYGWRAMFTSLGLLSLLWLIPWRWQLAQSAEVQRSSVKQGAGPAFSQILAQRALWAAMLGNFCSNYAFYFVFTWLPMYLVRERGYSLSSMVSVTTVFYLLDALGLLVTGWALDAWIRRGASANRAYRTALALSAAGVGVCLILTASADAHTAVALLLVAGVMDGLNSPSVCSLVQRFAGPLATGRWMGVQNAVANVAGILAPIVTGYLVTATGHYALALYTAGAVALVGLVSWLFLVPRVEPIDWSLRTGRTVPAADPG
jgi:MFS family permease